MNMQSLKELALSGCTVEINHEVTGGKPLRFSLVRKQQSVFDSYLLGDFTCFFDGPNLRVMRQVEGLVLDCLIPLKSITVI